MQDKENKDPKEEPLKGIEPEKAFLDELRKQSKDESKVKVFAISFNPIVFLIGAVIIAGILFAMYRGGNEQNNIVTLGEFVQNIKENKYSAITVQKSGTDEKAFAIGNEIVVSKIPDDYKVEFKEASTTQIYPQDSIKKIEDVQLIEDTSLLNISEAVKLIFAGKDSPVVEELVALDNRVYAIAQNGDISMVEDLTFDDLSKQYAAKGLKIANLPIARVLNGQKTSSSLIFDEFVKDMESGMYRYVVISDQYVFARLYDKFVIKDELDLTALNTDFPQLLKDNDIKLDNPNVDINPVTIKNFNYDLILQLAVLGAVIFLVFNILRGVSGGGKGLMQFGQSKAKVFFGRKPDVTFKDVAGVDSAKEELEEVVMFLKDPKRFTKLGARIPKGLLMVGSPGTGKTLLARAIAGEAGVPFFHTSGSEFEEMLVGAGASRVRDLFEKAKKAAPALVFIDEIDAVARKRGTTVQSSTTEQTLNQILVEMDGFEKNTNVIVIAATNRPDVLDPAILRPGRFDRRIVIEVPDIKGREDILKIHAKNKPLAEDVSIKKVARRTIGYSGADLENLLNEAAIIVAKDNRKEITFNDIEEAANRVTMGRERRIERDEEELKKTAYHEAGHAIVAKLTPESDPVHRITIVSRGMALGVTMQLPEKDKYSQSYTEMESRLRVLMAGRAAEELIYGAEKITSGASNDIEKATGIARRMVKSFGFSKKLGLVKYGESNELQYLGYGYGEQRDYSDETAKIIDEEVKRIIDEAYTDALRILTENKETLEKISDDLMKQEVLEGEEFERYFK